MWAVKDPIFLSVKYNIIAPNANTDNMITTN